MRLIFKRTSFKQQDSTFIAVKCEKQLGNGQTFNNYSPWFSRIHALCRLKKQKNVEKKMSNSKPLLTYNLLLYKLYCIYV